MKQEDKKWILFGLHYFLYFASLVTVSIFRVPFALKHSDTDASKIGFMFTLMPVIAIITKPLLGAIAGEFIFSNASLGDP